MRSLSILCMALFAPALTAQSTAEGFAIVVTATPNPLATSETGIFNTVLYTLTSAPTDPVVFNIDIDDDSEAALDLMQVQLDAGNWNTGFEVRVTGLNDDIQDGPQSFTLFAALSHSMDPNYHLIDVDDLFGSNADDGDMAGITVTPTAGLITNESGSTDQFTVVLDSEPIADVTLDFRSEDPGEGLVSDDATSFVETISLSFHASNWDTPQAVTIQGQDDAVRADGDVVFMVSGENVASADPIYAAFSDTQVPDVEVTNHDNDPDPEVLIAPLSLTLQEDGPAMTYSVRLATQPNAGDVTIAIVNGDPTEASVDPSSLTFGPSNWHIDQLVTVTPIQDFTIDPDSVFEIQHGPALNPGGNYHGLVITSVQITVLNTDTCGPMSLSGQIGEPITAAGTPTCVFDLFESGGSSNPGDWTLLGTFTVGLDGSTLTGVIAQQDSVYLTTITGTPVLLTGPPLRTVPALGQWCLALLIGLMLTMGLVKIRDRDLMEARNS